MPRPTQSPLTSPSLPSLTSLELNASPLTGDFYQWRIYQDGRPSPISLRIAPRPSSLIPKASLGRTILTTQQALRTYISGHYGATNDPLLPNDDPYKSSSQLTGCFVGIDSFPKGNRHLTYGVVALVLQGLWDFLYKGGRYVEAAFEVQDDQWGSVGIGKVSREAPR